MIRIRQSYLESFRRVVDTSYGREDELIAAIRGKPHEPNWMMEAGTAWHAAIADSGGRLWENNFRRCRIGDYTFEREALNVAIPLVGPGLREVPGSRVVPVMLGGRVVDVSLECTADHLRGLVITDHKTKFTQADPKDYESSLQWRVYLLVHEASVFRYLLWSFSDPKNGYCKLNGVMTCRFWTYPDLEAEVMFWLTRFLDWAGERRLLDYLTRNPHQEAA